MTDNYKIIDFESWKRKDYCNIYRNAVQPEYSVSFELDITEFKRYIKEKNLSFTMAFIYAVTKCANEIEEFRYRFLDNNVVLYDKIDTSFTYLIKETELFKVVNVPMQETLEKFVDIALTTATNQKVPFTGPLENDVYIFSSLPWVTFSHVSHTDFGNKGKAQPMFDFGKYYEKDGRIFIPFSVQVHHAFIDGIHIGKLADKLQNFLKVSLN